MTNEYPAGTPAEGGSSIGGTAQAAREQAGNVGHEAAESAKNVAGTAKEEAGKVVGESAKQAKALYEEARGQLTEQAGVQQERVASGLRNIGDELTRMAESSDQQGIAGDLVSQAASRASAVATWLDGRDPGSVVTEVTNFARRKPGTFIAISAVAGLVAGRLVKSLASQAADEKAAEAAAPTAPVSTPTPATPAATPAAYGTETPLFDAVRPTTTTGFEPTSVDGRQL
ncbi:hypothetical protein [Conyzicola sp.]|uniref:hypothetical protein n=1 Tax=Conyzicola sp. TaxID=1969404 RepID=UPI0039892C1E